MIDALTVTVIAASLLVAAWTGLLTLRARAARRGTLIALGLVELLVLAQAVVAAVLLVRGQRPADVVTFAGYHVAAILTLPAGVGWAVADRSRWSTVVLTVAALTVAVLTVRLQQLWTAA